MKTQVHEEVTRDERHAEYQGAACSGQRAGLELASRFVILFASPNTPLLAAGMQAQTKYVSGDDSLQRTHPDTPQFTAGLGSFSLLPVSL